MGKVIGIDLGTTNSVVSVFEGDAPYVIPTKEGGGTLPSIVAFTEDGEVVIGNTAKNQRAVNPDTISSVKRFMGRRYDEVEGEREQVPYKVVEGTNGRAEIEIEGKRYTPEQISARILGELKANAEAYLGEEVTDAVITVPAYFNDQQRQATKDAGKIAGLNVLRIVNEPTAAALAYGLDKGGKDLETVLVFDLGGGTFDVSLLEIEDGFFDVKATSGDTHLGGDDYDRAVYEWVADKIMADHGADINDSIDSRMRVMEAAEKAKIELSGATQASIVLPYFGVGDNKPPVNVSYKLSRAEFNKITKPLTERCRQPIQDCLNERGLTAADIDQVILVGGSTRIPAVQTLVTEIFGQKKINKSVDVDKVVGEGAAVQGAVLTGEVDDVTLVDVTPLTIGINTRGGVTSPMIPRNTAVPTKFTKVFTTSDNNQTSVLVTVVQGESTMTDRNRVLGQFSLPVPPAPAGTPNIEVTFGVDVNGILEVSARDLKFPDKVAAITITQSTSLDADEIERMVAEAAEHAAEDRARAEAVDARIMADELADGAERSLDQYRDLLSGALVTELTTNITDLRTANAGVDDAALVAAFRTLQANVSRIGEEVYAENGEAPDAPAAPAAAADTPAKGKPAKGAAAKQAPPERDIDL